MMVNFQYLLLAALSVTSVIAGLKEIDKPRDANLGTWLKDWRPNPSTKFDDDNVFITSAAHLSKYLAKLKKAKTEHYHKVMFLDLRKWTKWNDARMEPSVNLPRWEEVLHSERQGRVWNQEVILDWRQKPKAEQEEYWVFIDDSKNTKAMFYSELMVNYNTPSLGGERMRWDKSPLNKINIVLVDGGWQAIEAQSKLLGDTLKDYFKGQKYGDADADWSDWSDEA